MRLAVAWPVVLGLGGAALALGCAAATPAPVVGTPVVDVAPPAPACEPGGLVFSAPYLPSGVLFVEDGRGLVLVDRGALTVRDPATLAVRRTLLPKIGQWTRISQSTDGKRLFAETVDGLRFSFDTVTWKPTRLADDRSAGSSEAKLDDELSSYVLRFRGTSALAKGGQQGWAVARATLGLPELRDGTSALAFVSGSARKDAAGEGVLAPLDLAAGAQDPDTFRAFLADSEGGLHVYDVDRELTTSRALAPARATALSVSAGRLLVALDTGEVAVLHPDLSVESRLVVRAPRAVEPVPIVSRGEPATERHGLLAVELDPTRKRLAWVSTDGAVGVRDLQTGRAVAELAGTGAALLDALWLDERRVVLHAAAGLTVWDTVAGKVIAERPTAYRTLVEVSGGLLAVESHGRAALLDPATLKARRELCFLASGCDDTPPRPEGFPDEAWRPLSQQEKKRLGAAFKTRDDRAFEVRVAASPDGRTLAVLHPPLEVVSPHTPGDLSLWDLATLTKGPSVALERCYDWSLAWASPTILDVCGDHRRDARTLAVTPGKPQKPERDPFKVEPERTRVGGVEVEVHQQAHGEIIVVTKGEEGLVDIAWPESKGHAPEDEVRDQERLQLREKTLVRAAPGGRRFILVGLGGREESGNWLFPGYASPAGPLEVWCAPTGPSGEAPLPVPDDPPLGDFAGITERAVDGFPEVVTAAAEAGARVFVLGADAAGKAPRLVSFGTDLARLTEVHVPAGGPWKKLHPSPLGETVWLEGDAAVARLGRDGAWSTFALERPGGAPTKFFAPISAGAAVAVANVPCGPAQAAVIKSKANLRAYFDNNKGRVTHRRSVQGAELRYVLDVEGREDARAKAERARWGHVVTTLLRAPRADFAAVQTRLRRDFSFGESSATSGVGLNEGQLTAGDAPLARLFDARPGAIVGPIETREPHPGSTRVRVTTRFVRVDRVSPVDAFADLVARAETGQWWPLGNNDGCTEVSVVGLSRPVQRSIIPPHASHTFVAWSGGFAAVGNPLAVYRDGEWLAASSPLARKLGALDELGPPVLGAGRRLYVNRAHDIEVIDAATGRTERTIAQGDLGPAQAVQAGSDGREIVLAVAPGGPLIATDGTPKDLGTLRVPLWAGIGDPPLAPGQTARVVTTRNAVGIRDGAHWTFVFNAAARRRGLAALRRQ